MRAYSNSAIGAAPEFEYKKTGCLLMWLIARATDSSMMQGERGILVALGLIILVLAFVENAHARSFLRAKGGRLQLKKIPRNILAEQLPVPRWFNQTLDHFNSSDMRMWPQRYYVNDVHWNKPSGPVFLFISGEGPAEPEWLAGNCEFMLNAAKYNALAVMLEHRY